MNKKFVLVSFVFLPVMAIAVFLILKIPESSKNNSIQQTGGEVSWQFDQTSKTWQNTGSSPPCPEPLTFPSPVDINLVSGILYPGQVRGGDYKAHGGFRFDNLQSNEVKVYAPLDARVVQAARHTQGGEIQYVLYFINDCGIMYKLDHLLEVTEKFQNIMESIPLAGDADTRTTQVNPSVYVAKGELVATKVGLEKTKNIFFDFGVYDLRKTNGVDYSSRNYFNIEEHGMYAICWLDNLEEPTKSIAKSLSGADGQMGKTSDYCD